MVTIFVREQNHIVKRTTTRQNTSSHSLPAWWDFKGGERDRGHQLNNTTSNWTTIQQMAVIYANCNNDHYGTLRTGAIVSSLARQPASQLLLCTRICKFSKFANSFMTVSRGVSLSLTLFRWGHFGWMGMFGIIWHDNVIERDHMRKETDF